MDEDRFQQLINTYGASPRRWPEAEREAAMQLASASPGAAARLARASALDGALEAWILDHPRTSLREQILLATPGWRVPAYRQPRVWWAGAGLAAACALGVVAGALTSGPLLHGPRGDVAVLAGFDDNTTVFGTSLDAGAGS